MYFISAVQRRYSQEIIGSCLLEIIERRWSSLTTYFIVYLQNAKNVYDSIKKRVDHLSQRVHFEKARTTDTSIEVSDMFFADIFNYHVMTDSIMSYSDCSFNYES